MIDGAGSILREAQERALHHHSLQPAHVRALVRAQGMQITHNALCALKVWNMKTLNLAIARAKVRGSLTIVRLDIIPSNANG